MEVVKSVLELVGNTPLLQVDNILNPESCEIYAKLEAWNPGKSIKDRAALNMILKAEKEGFIKPDTTIVEATSGNTGIALAMICAAKNLELILVIPNCMSIDKINMVKALGAQVVLTEGLFGMKRAYAEAERIAAKIEGAFIPNQMENSNNPEAHYINTGNEIWRQTQGKVDVFVAGIGTGGTISGTGRRLKELNPNIEVIGIEPEASAVLNGGRRGPHKLQGVGAGFIPKNYCSDYVDRVITVKDNDALNMSRRLAQEKGIFVGISSGAASYVAMNLARDLKEKKCIVTVFPDTGERYLGTELFNSDIKDDFVN